MHNECVHFSQFGEIKLTSVGSKNIPSLSSRVGEDLVDAIYMLATITKGTPIFYSGDKVGVSNVPSENKTSNSNGGLINENSSLHVNLNLTEQVQDKSKQSHSKILSRLLALRGQPALNFGLQAYPIVTNETISLIRVRKGSPGYLVVVNLGKDSVKLDFTGKSGFLPETARVEIRSSNIVDGPLMDGEHPKISLDDVHLGPKQSVVFSFVPIFEG
ncbi:uncharacterized protein TNIN_241682 [Trichonephila inaurata madagascariensis]|uniref:Uncharacterized protein n=1 Tax=Trichonephila inaurata madagascariensis TaxID=2747483 RepID=A0A8X7CQ78_9ARAC|nr:uncharacterized protein TNIN_241682 [Trichonephila inaurata madagascariensis]